MGKNPRLDIAVSDAFRNGFDELVRDAAVTCEDQ